MQTRPKYETHAPDDGTAAILRTLDGRTIALRGVSIRVALRDLICETEVIQKYQNSENTNIEAVYTFPLPVDAVLLDLEVKLAGKTLRGCVIERRPAGERSSVIIASLLNDSRAGSDQGQRVTRGTTAKRRNGGEWAEGREGNRKAISVLRSRDDRKVILEKDLHHPLPT